MWIEIIMTGVSLSRPRRASQPELPLTAPVSLTRCWRCWSQTTWTIWLVGIESVMQREKRVRGENFQSHWHLRYVCLGFWCSFFACLYLLHVPLFKEPQITGVFCVRDMCKIHLGSSETVSPPWVESSSCSGIIVLGGGGGGGGALRRLLCVSS